MALELVQRLPGPPLSPPLPPSHRLGHIITTRMSALLLLLLLSMAFILLLLNTHVRRSYKL